MPPVFEVPAVQALFTGDIAVRGAMDFCSKVVPERRCSRRNGCNGSSPARTITWTRDMAGLDWQLADPSGMAEVWLAVDGTSARMYGVGEVPDDATALTCLRCIPGASSGAVATHHYVVETDVAARDEAEFNAWYEQEHLPGLARVPGTIVARRFARASGSPRYMACYDLTSPNALQHPAWLGVRHTAWSSRVRPMVLKTRRTMFVRAHRQAAPATAGS